MGKRLHYKRSVRLSDHRRHPVTVRMVDPAAKPLDLQALRNQALMPYGSFDPRQVLR